VNPPGLALLSMKTLKLTAYHLQLQYYILQLTLQIQHPAFVAPANEHMNNVE
jgi:hypothetical protein